MIIPVNADNGSYDIVLERGCLKNAGQLLNLDRRALIVTDDGVPEQYARCVAAQCAQPFVRYRTQGRGQQKL